ncbi:MAG: NB-ARC domain-containing protein [Isosphaeraceae bacterium]|nr:NB-ARC domain-containing protein [Isosphaeraceae bacterium]
MSKPPPSPSPDDGLLELPDAFLRAVEEKKSKLTWPKMRADYQVASSTHQGWKASGQGRPDGVLLTCIAFHLRDRKTFADLGFEGASLEKLRAAFDPEKVREAFPVKDLDDSRLAGLLDEMTRPPLRVLGVLPPLPRTDLYLERKSVIDAVIALLLAETGSAVAITGKSVALRSQGGAGKSVTAAAVARDERIAAAFLDGVAWVTLGQEFAGKPEQRERLARELVRALEIADAGDDPERRIVAINRTLQERRLLLILDDVWSLTDLRGLDPGPGASRLLITTRQRDLARDLGAHEYPLGLLSEPEALELLAKASGRPIAERDLAAAKDVARQCGYLPLALAIAGAEAADTPWSRLLEALRKADLSYLAREGFDPRYDSVLLSIQASIRFMESRDRDRRAARLFQALAVFPADESVAVAAVVRLWSHREKLEPHAVEHDLRILERRSLLELVDPTEAEPRDLAHCLVALHDLHHDYVRYHQEDPRGGHRTLLDAYRPASGDWADLEPDGYILEHLHMHLRAAGREAEAESLLFDAAWLETKLRTLGLEAATSDFSGLPADHEALWVRDALRLAGHILTRDPAQLRSQLHGRLLAANRRAALDRLRVDRTGAPWIELLSPTLEPPRSGRSRTLEGHSFSLTCLEVDEHEGSCLVASGGRDKAIRLWNLDDHAPLGDALVDDLPIACLAFYRLGEVLHLIAGFEDGRFRRWNLMSREEILPVRQLPGLSIQCIRAYATGDRVRSILGTSHGLIDLDPASGELVLIDGSPQNCRLMSTYDSPHGPMLLSLHDDRLIEWDLDPIRFRREIETPTQGLPISRIAVHEGDVAVQLAVSFSHPAPLAQTLWFMERSAIALGDLSQDPVRFVLLERETESVGPVCWAELEEGLRLVTAASSGVIRILDPLSGTPDRPPLVDRSSGAIALSTTRDRSGRSLLISGSESGVIHIWDPSNRSEYDGEATRGRPTDLVEGPGRFDAERPRIPPEAVSRRLTCIAIHPRANGPVIALGTERGPLVRRPGESTARALPYPPAGFAHRERTSIKSATFARGGRLILWAGYDGKVRGGNWDDGEIVFELDHGHSDAVSIDPCLRIFTHSRGSEERVIVMGFNSISRWRIDSSPPVLIDRFPALIDRLPIEAELLLHDGRELLAVLDTGGRLHILDLVSMSWQGEPLPLDSHWPSPLHVPRWEGDVVAVTSGIDGMLRIVDLLERRILSERPTGHTRRVTSIGSLQIEGRKLLITCGRDRSVRIASFKDGRVLASLHLDHVVEHCIAFPTGPAILVADAGGIVHELRLTGLDSSQLDRTSA